MTPAPNPANWLTADPALFSETERRIATGLPGALQFAVPAPALEAALQAATQSASIPVSTIEGSVLARFVRPLISASGHGPLAPAARFWQRRLAVAGTALRRASRATGYILVQGIPGLHRAGSGWLISDSVLVTAASVAARFSDPALGSATVQVLFEDGITARVTRTRVSPAAPRAAFLHLEFDAPLPDAIPLLEGSPANPYIAVIGDVTRDSRTGAPVLDLVYEGVFERKCLAPGRVVQSTATTLSHDCATLGDMSGSVLVDLETGQAAGLHLAGSLGEPGVALPSSALFTAMEALQISPALPFDLSAEEDFGLEAAPKLTAADYADRKGYDTDLLGTAVPFPTVPDSTDVVTLPYTHFTVGLSKGRRMPWYTAVNIRGAEAIEIKRGQDKWAFDPRLDRNLQAGPELYTQNDFDLGHMVRRLDPDWGADAEKADIDTFHYTNACPQHKDLNRKIWNDLEDYVLKNTAKEKLVVTVFTGPVFAEDDPPYRGYRVPMQYWKLVVMRKENGDLSATAYILSQADMVTSFEFTFGEFRTYQLPITELEALTKLDFGELRNFDPKRSQEGPESATHITGPNDVVV